SVVDAVLVRALPYPESDRLVTLWEARDGVNDLPIPAMGTVRPSVSPANLVDYNTRTSRFDAFAGYNLVAKNLTQSGPPERLIGEAVTFNYFTVLGIQPALGRAFRAEDDRPGADRVLILTDGLWRSRFAASPSAIGRRITLDGEPHEIIGVLPASF